MCCGAFSASIIEGVCNAVYTYVGNGIVVIIFRLDRLFANLIHVRLRPTHHKPAMHLTAPKM